MSKKINILWSNANIGGAEIYVSRLNNLIKAESVCLQGLKVSKFYEFLKTLFDKNNTFIFHDGRASIFSILRFLFRKDYIVIHGPTKYPMFAKFFYFFLSYFVKKIVLVDKNLLGLQKINNVEYVKNESALPFSLESYGNDFVYIGRIEKSKRVDFLCDFWSKNNFKRKLRIIGSGSILENLKKQYNTSSIIFHGARDQKDMKDILKNCRYYISMSKVEGVSLALQESLLIGLIPIVMDIPSQRYLYHKKLPLVSIDDSNLFEIIGLYCDKDEKQLDEISNFCKQFSKEINNGAWEKFWLDV